MGFLERLRRDERPDGAVRSETDVAAFSREVARTGVVWTLKRRDAPAETPDDLEGRGVQPFWSSRERVQELTHAIPQWQGFEPQELALAEWEARWLPAMLAHGVQVGPNWSGPRAEGTEVAVETALRHLRAAS